LKRRRPASSWDAPGIVMGCDDDDDDGDGIIDSEDDMISFTDADGNDVTDAVLEDVVELKRRQIMTVSKVEDGDATIRVYSPGAGNEFGHVRLMRRTDTGLQYCEGNEHSFVTPSVRARDVTVVMEYDVLQHGAYNWFKIVRDVMWVNVAKIDLQHEQGFYYGSIEASGSKMIDNELYLLYPPRLYPGYPNPLWSLMSVTPEGIESATAAYEWEATGAGQTTIVDVTAAVNVILAFFGIEPIPEAKYVLVGFEEPGEYDVKVKEINSGDMDQIAVNVIELEVDWIDPASDSILSDPNCHPSDNGEERGVRYFPGATTPGGIWNDTLTVRVSVGPAEEGQMVFLRVFDPDNPSTDGDVVDDGPSGRDNKDTLQRGRLVDESGPTDASGVFETTFKVSHQPGDNYRVAVTLFDATELDKLRDGTSPNVHACDSQQPMFFGRLSRLLTVWRRLNIEVDSMTAIPSPMPAPDRKTLASGSSWHIGWAIDRTAPTGMTPVPSHAVLELTGSPLDDDRFYMFGRIVSQNTEFEVSDHTDELIQVFQVPTPSQQALFVGGQSFELFDDDGKHVPAQWLPMLPRFNIVGALTIAKYEPAYIDLQVVPGSLNPRTAVPFSLNESIDSVWGTVLNNSKDVHDSEAFWAHTVVAAYQIEASADGDPNSEETDMGNSEDGVQVSAVYLEAVREVLRGVLHHPNAAQLYTNTVYGCVAHEIGHMPGHKADHWEGGLMGEGVVEGDFSDHTLLRFRKAKRWYDE